MIAWLVIAAVCVAVLGAFHAALARWDGSGETPRRAGLSRAGVLLPWSRVAGRVRGWGRTTRTWARTLTQAGPAVDAFCAALGWRTIPPPPPAPGPELKVVIEASTPQDMAGEIAATSPWNDAAGSFTAYIDAGEPS